MMSSPTARLARSAELARKVSQVFHARATRAHERFTTRMQTSFAEHVAQVLTNPTVWWQLWMDGPRHAVDLVQRSVLFWDTLRQRGNDFVERTRAGLPPVLHFAWEMVLDGRTFARPVNYALVRITPPRGVTVDARRRPYVIIDPRAGHGPGIGGFKDDSQVGVALAAGHPVYFVIFFPEPMAGQTILDVCAAEQAFVREVRALHPDSPRPVIVGNCQGGWAAMMLAAASPDDAGPIVINGAPMSYWGGAWQDGEGDNPMRYAGGLLGGTWLASLTADLGHGTFDGAWLVQNFESLNPANTFWDKYYHLFANVDTEPPRFLEFERWWGGFYLMNREEIEWITRDLFVGNRLWSGDGGAGRAFDLREIRSPIVLFASMGDNITPPQQAFNWVADVYGSTEEIKARGQVIVGLLHQDIGHLGIFVSGRVARKEHAQIVSVMKSIEALPPGLYGMRILDRRSAGGGVEYDVEFVEHRLEEVAARLNRFERVDEKPFEAVEAISAFNQRAYELFAQPLMQALSSEPAARVGRALHPLRLQRWALSDAFNPWVWWLGPAADAVRAQRNGRAEVAGAEAVQAMTSVNPWRWWLGPVMEAWVPRPAVASDEPARRLERMVSETTSAMLDYARDLRDATGEALFFLTYGNLFSFYLADKAPAPVTAAGDPRELSYVKEALAAIEQGGYAEALARVAALINRDGERIPLARLELRRDLLQDYREFLPAVPPDQMRRIRGEQDIIVRYEPARALATLPRLLADPGDRDRLLAFVGRLADDERVRARRLTPQDRARIDAVLGVLRIVPSGALSASGGRDGARS